MRKTSFKPQPLLSKVPIILPKYSTGQRQLRYSFSEISDFPAPSAPPMFLLFLEHSEATGN